MNNAKRLLLGQPKVIKVKIILSFLKLIKRSQTIFHAHTMRVSQVIRSKKSNFIVGSNFSCSIVFYDLSMKVQQQILICFCKFCCNSVIIMCLVRFLT